MSDGTITTSSSSPTTTTTIGEIWSRRSLIRTFAVNDLVIRYKSSVLGVIWSLIEPLFMLAILYVIFTHVFKTDIENYQLYLLLGIIIWSFFSRATTTGINSFLGRAGVITQIYFPREILPISACVTALLILGIEFGVFIAFLAVFQFVPPATAVILPGVVGLLFALTLGISLLLSVLNVRFRDIQSMWGIVTYAGFFVTPIIYRIDVFPEEVQRILLISPVTQIMEMAHQAVLFGELPAAGNVAYTVLVTFGILAAGYLVFRRYQFKATEEI